MNFNLILPKSWLFKILVLCSVIVCLGMPRAQAAADIAPSWGYFPLWTNSCPAAAAATNTVYHAAIDVDQGKTLVIFPSIVTGGASTSNVTYSFRTSLDGALWTPGFSYSGAVALTGTTSNLAAVVVATNIQARFIAWDKVDTTALGSVTLHSLGYAWLPAVGR